MALKRAIDDTEQPICQAESPALRKRARLSPSATTLSDSSAMSPDSISRSSALSSSPGVTARRQESSVSSVPSHGDAEDSDSSTESSDDNASWTAGGGDDDDDADETVCEANVPVTIGGPKKPTIDAGVLSGASDLASRLKAFLPQMQQANSELARKGAGMSMEDVDDDAEHIEMSLGLGVLEQKKVNDLDDLLRKESQTCSNSEENSESDDDDDDDKASKDEPDVLDRLMNMERDMVRNRQPGIEEVESRPDRP